MNQIPIRTTPEEYEILPFVDLHAPKAFSSRNRTRTGASPDNAMQDFEDTKTTLRLAGLWINLSLESIIVAHEKYMVELHPVNTSILTSQNTDISMRQKGARKPHFSHLLIFDNTLVFQAACCLPLKIVAASLNGHSVSGRVLFASHSEESGGRLVYQFRDKGTEMILDLQRGESPRAQRYIFRGI